MKKERDEAEEKGEKTTKRIQHRAGGDRERERERRRPQRARWRFKWNTLASTTVEGEGTSKQMRFGLHFGVEDESSVPGTIHTALGPF